MRKISEPVWLLAAVMSCAGIYIAGDLFATPVAPRNGWMVDGNFRTPRFGIDRSEGSRSERWTSDQPWSAFRGLDAAMLGKLKGRHAFEMVRSGGTFVCTGEFGSGRGSGSYTFKPNVEFVSKLQQAGYAMPAEEDLFQMAISDMPLEFALALKSAHAGAAIEDLLELSSNGLNAETIRGFTAAGMTRLSVKDYLVLRNHGVGAEFLRDLKAAGYDIPATEIVQLLDNGVDGRYVRELSRAGLQPPVNDLLDLRNNGISTDTLRLFAQAGVVDPGDVIDMNNQGVRAEFVKQAKGMGYGFSRKELIAMHQHGVDVPYLRKLKDTGFNKLDAQMIIKLRTHGID